MRPIRHRLLVALAVVLTSSIAGDTGPARAVAATPSPLAEWQIWTPPGKQAAQFAEAADGGLAVTSHSGVSFLIRPLTAVEAAAPHLVWRWRVDAAPPATDLTIKGGDDRALAVHVWFPADPARRPPVPSWVAAALRMLGPVPGVPRDGYMLSYAWGGLQPAGTMVANPYMERAVLFVRRGHEAATATWHDERVDLADDFRRAFGMPPPAPAAYIAISTDTDATGSQSAGIIASLGFVASE